MNFKFGERSREWVKRLPEVVSALNNEETRLTEKNLLMQSKKKFLRQNLQALIQGLLA